jgi:hypothetical protein
MDTGFGENLKGFLITGNLSILKGQNPLYNGDGSLEGTGTLYFDTIKQFSDLNGLTIQDININNNQIYIPFTKPSSNISSASFIIDGGISITNTSNSLNISNGGALTIAGGVSISKNVNIGMELNMNYNKIINVNDPENDYDVVNKRYLNNFTNTITHGNVIGNFGEHEIITGTSDPTKIVSQPNFKYIPDNLNLILENSQFTINSTQNVSGSSGGVLISYGGVNIQNNLFVKDQVDVNNNNIKNVKMPIDDYDAVPKKYVLDLFNSFFNAANTFYIEDSQLIFTPTNIILDDNVIFANLHIYISIDSSVSPRYSIVNLLLYKNQSTNNWIYSKTFVGDNTMVQFEIQNNILHYTNPNTSLSNSSFIITHTNLQLTLPITETLTNSFSFTFTFEFLQNTLNQQFYTIDLNDISFITYFYIYNNTTNEYGIIKLYSVKKGLNWYNNFSKHSQYSFIHNITINIESSQFIYSNTNSNNYTMLMYSTQIDDIPTDLVLNANTTTFSKINEISFNQFEKSFYLTLYLEADSNVSLYELYGIYNNNNWNLHVNLIGDPFTSTQVQFEIDTDGVLNYINLNNFDATIKYILFESFVLPVKYGGTGTNYHLTDAVLLGNGVNPIKSLSSLTYSNNQLQLKSTHENSINTLGGISLQNTINMNNNRIINLDDPVNDTDAVNKRYLNSVNIFGEYTAGQLIVANSNNSVKGYDNLLFDTSNTFNNLLINNTNITITDTTNTSNFNINIPVNIESTLSMQNNQIKNVNDPTDNKDAVNKQFLENHLNNTFSDNLLQLNNNVIIPSPLNFIITPDKNAFIIYIYIHKNHEICSLYILKGLLNNDQLYVNQTFIGASLGITFSLDKDINNNYIIYYTNPNLTDTFYIRINFINVIFDSPQDNQINYTLSNNQTIFTSSDLNKDMECNKGVNRFLNLSIGSCPSS